MKKKKHSPLPFVVQESDHPGGLLIKPVPGQVVCQLDELPNMKENAAFIVRACNSHYELLEACKLALAAFERNDAIDWGILEQAIEKAEGK